MEISDSLKSLTSSLAEMVGQGNEMANSISFFSGDGLPKEGKVILKAGLPVPYVPVGSDKVSLHYRCTGNPAVEFIAKGTLFGKHYVPADKKSGQYPMSELLCRASGLQSTDYRLHSLTVPGKKAIQVVEFLHDMEVTFSTIAAILPQRQDAYNKATKLMAMNREEDNYVILTLKPKE